MLVVVLFMSLNSQAQVLRKDLLSLSDVAIDILGKNAVQIYNASKAQEIPNIIGGGNHDGAGESYKNGDVKVVVNGVIACYNHAPTSRCKIGGLIQKDIKKLSEIGQARFSKVSSRKLYKAFLAGQITDEFESVRFSCHDEETCFIQFNINDFNVRTSFRN